MKTNYFAGIEFTLRDTALCSIEQNKSTSSFS